MPDTALARGKFGDESLGRSGETDSHFTSGDVKAGEVAAAPDVNGEGKPEASAHGSVLGEHPDHLLHRGAGMEAAGDKMDDMAVVDSPGAAGGESIHDHEGIEAKVIHLIGEYMKDNKLSKEQLQEKILACLALLPDHGEQAEPEMPMPVSDEPEVAEAIKQLKASTDPRDKEILESLQTVLREEKDRTRELDALSAQKAWREKVNLATKLCSESRLPKTTITQVFIEEVARAKDERGMKLLIEDRQAVVSIRKPKSTSSFIGGGTNGGKELDVKSFAEACRK